MRDALKNLLRYETFAEVYDRRGIGLCISATDIQTHQPTVFKTPHVSGKHRDNEMTLLDACMASSAAPVYLPIAPLKSPAEGVRCYMDGGLWANNPVVIGLLEGLKLAAPKQPIVVLSVGTCLPPSGFRAPKRHAVGLWYWMSDVRLLHLAMNSQARAAQYSADLLASSMRDMGRDVTILRCEETKASDEQAPQLQLDSTSADALDLMANFGDQDTTMTYRWTHTSSRRREGELLKLIFGRMLECPCGSGRLLRHCHGAVVAGVCKTVDYLHAKSDLAYVQARLPSDGRQARPQPNDLRNHRLQSTRQKEKIE